MYKKEREEKRQFGKTDRPEELSGIRKEEEEKAAEFVVERRRKERRQRRRKARPK